MPLMAHKRTATLLLATEELLTVLEFFAVGESPTAVLLCAVKGGGSLPLTDISAIFKVHLSPFSLLSFFIGHLTLSYLILSRSDSSSVSVEDVCDASDVCAVSAVCVSVPASSFNPSRVTPRLF